jgi:hypothetical protein
MNQDQSNHFTSDESVLQTLTDYQSIWSSNTVFTSTVTAFKTKVNGVSALIIGQINNSQGITMSKAQIKANLIALTVAHADGARAYGVNTNNTPLVQNLKITKTSLERLTDAELAPICQNVYNIANPLVASLGGYGVNTASLLALQADVTAFSSMVGMPESTRAVVKAYTNSLEQQLDSIDVLLKQQLDPLMTQYKTTQAVFYDAYFGARKLNLHGHRNKVVVKGKVTYGGVLVAHVLVSCIVNGKKHKKVTDGSGEYLFLITPPANTTISADLTGYPVQTKPVNVSVAQTVVLNFAF